MNDNLLEQTINELNSDFYTKFNPYYFRDKISYHLAVLDDIDWLSSKYESGVEIGELKASGNKLEGKERKYLIQTIKTEISLIYYHAIETFFRLFISHSYKTECPWLEIADLTSFKKFKDIVKKIKDGKFPSKSVAFDDLVSSIIFGNINLSNNIDESKWDKNINNTVEFIHHFAESILNNQNYNAYKHGLSIFSSELGFSIEGTPIERKKSDILIYLVTEKEDGQTNYAKAYKYLDWEQKVAEIFILSELISNIFEIGKRIHFSKEKNTKVKIKLIDHVSLINIYKEGFHTNEIKMSLPIHRTSKKE